MINVTFSVMPLPSLSLSNTISLDYIPHLLAPKSLWADDGKIFISHSVSHNS